VKGDNAQFAEPNPEPAGVTSLQNFAKNNPLDVNSLVVKKKQDTKRQRVLTNLERHQNTLTKRNAQLANALLTKVSGEEIKELKLQIGTAESLVEKEYFRMQENDREVMENIRKKVRDFRLGEFEANIAKRKERRDASKKKGGSKKKRRTRKKKKKKRRTRNKSISILK
jgi:hypothetical protein